MPGKKLPRKNPQATSEPPWQVILEDIQSKFGIVIEAVQGVRDTLERKIDERGEKTDARLQVLELAVRDNSTDIRALVEEVHQNSTDIGKLQGAVRHHSTDIRALKGEVRQNSTDIGKLQGEVRELKDGLT